MARPMIAGRRVGVIAIDMFPMVTGAPPTGVTGQPRAVGIPHAVIPVAPGGNVNVRRARHERNVAGDHRERKEESEKKRKHAQKNHKKKAQGWPSLGFGLSVCAWSAAIGGRV